MPEELGIYVTMYDKFSPAVKSMGNNTKAFNKAMQELEQTCAEYEKKQVVLVKDMAALKIKLTESNQKVKEAKSVWGMYKDDVSKRTLDSAIKEQTEYRAKLDDTAAALKDQRKAVRDLAEDTRKAANGQTGGAGGNGPVSLGKGLLSAGLGQMLGSAAGQLSGAILSSAIGEPEARLASSTLSGVISGGMMGAVMGLPGIVTGAVLGGVSGLASGGAEIFRARDDAFKSYYNGLQTSGAERRATELESGSTIAGGRESTRLAFDKLLGDEAEGYLKEVQKLAVDTNYTYDEITGYTKKMLNSFDSGTVLDMLMELSDATAGLSLNSSDVDMFVSGLNRMQTTGKATREYLNYFDDRGLDTSAALASYLKVDKSAVSDMITKGGVSGPQAVEAIRAYIRSEYGGLSADLAGSYNAMVDNLGDTMDNINAALGSAYENEIKEGIGADMEAYGGTLGDAMVAMNGMIGEGKGIAENLDRTYHREAMAALLMGEATTAYGEEQAAALADMHERYLDAVSAFIGGTEEEKAIAAGQMDALKTEAEGMADAAFQASDMSQGLIDVEIDLIAAIRANTDALGIAAYGKDYRTQREQSKGTADLSPIMQAGSDFSRNRANAMGLGGGFAYGLDRVPYDNFPALLHQGERVLTASQARRADTGGGVNVTFSGPVTVREEADLEKLARRFAAEVQRAALLAAP